MQYNANKGANTTSEIDERGRKTKLCYMYSGTNANAIHMQLQHLKLISAVAKKNMRHGPGELSARRRGNRSQGDGGTALSTARNRYPFFTVRTPQASLVGEQCIIFTCVRPMEKMSKSWPKRVVMIFAQLSRTLPIWWARQIFILEN